MVQNKIVVRFQNGNVMKGFTADFMPNKDVLHLTRAMRSRIAAFEGQSQDCKACSS